MSGISEWTKTYRHVKTGGLYKVITQAKLEATFEDMIVYRALDDHAEWKIWIRPMKEFFDGRFVIEQEQSAPYGTDPTWPGQGGGND